MFPKVTLCASYVLTPFVPFMSDLWSSGSSGDGRLPQADHTAWVKNDNEVEASSRSPDASEVSSPLPEEPNAHAAIGNEGILILTPQMTAPMMPSTSMATTPKAKARASFSESQMSTLVQRFSVQRYLTPSEMKDLAEVTGLTYKQVRDSSLLAHKQNNCQDLFHILLHIKLFMFFEGENLVSEPKDKAEETPERNRLAV